MESLILSTAKLIALATALVVTAASAQAVTVARGGTGSTGNGGFTTPVGTTDTDSTNWGFSSAVTTPASNWVWVNSPLVEYGSLDFTFMFDLTNHNLASATLAGLWGADNSGTVSLNGTEIASLRESYDAFNTLHSFTEGNAMPVAGMNTLSFHVTNNGGPGGLRASVIVDAAQVPVPAGLPLLASALVGMGFVASRKRKV